MMTKTTLKALYVGGGGLVATWLAVTPNPGAPTAATTTTQPVAAVREPSAEELSEQAERLRARSNGVALRPSKRNPFRFAAPRSPNRSDTRLEWLSPPAPVVPPPVVAPAVALSGIAEKATTNGVIRTAVISSGTQIYLVSEGDSVAGHYTVARIDREAVVLRDETGAEITLQLH